MFTQEHIQRLLDIANVGCSKGHILEARTIYDGILSMHPDSVLAHIGLAFSHIVVNEFVAAETILREKVLSADPQDEEGRAMLGLCLALAGNMGAAKEFLEPLAQEGGPRAKLAESLLEQATA